MDNKFELHHATARSAARDAERCGSEPVTGTPFLQEEDQHLLDRFIETTEDNEGFDIGKEAIKRLANLGVVESLGFGRYSVTMFGYWVHEHYWYQYPSLPLKTNLDRDADARAAIAQSQIEMRQAYLNDMRHRASGSRDWRSSEERNTATPNTTQQNTTKHHKMS